MVKDRQAQRVDGMLLDMQTANMLLSVHSKVNAKNKRTLEAKNLRTAVHVCTRAAL